MPFITDPESEHDPYSEAVKSACSALEWGLEHTGKMNDTEAENLATMLALLEAI